MIESFAPFYFLQKSAKKRFLNVASVISEEVKIDLQSNLIQRKPVFYALSSITSFLGLATPFLVILLVNLIDNRRMSDESYSDRNPGNALLLIVLGLAGSWFWAFIAVISIVLIGIAFIRKENGKSKFLAIPVTGLSAFLGIMVFLACWAFSPNDMIAIGKMILHGKLDF